MQDNFGFLTIPPPAEEFETIGLQDNVGGPSLQEGGANAAGVEAGVSTSQPEAGAKVSFSQEPLSQIRLKVSVQEKLKKVTFWKQRASEITNKQVHPHFSIGDSDDESIV